MKKLDLFPELGPVRRQTQIQRVHTSWWLWYESHFKCFPRAVESALQPSKTLEQWFSCMLLREIYSESPIIYLAHLSPPHLPPQSLSLTAVSKFGCAKPQTHGIRKTVMRKHKHEFPLMCRALWSVIFHATPSGCLWWGFLPLPCHWSLMMLYLHAVSHIMRLCCLQLLFAFLFVFQLA